MNTNPHVPARQAPTNIGGPALIALGWLTFAAVAVLNPGEPPPDAPAPSLITSAVVAYLVYALCAAILAVSIISLKNSARMSAMIGGATNYIFSAVSFVSAMSVVTLGLLRLYGKI